MKKDKITKTIIWSLISFLTILTGLLLIVQVQRIYRTPTDGDTFTRTKVGEYLLEIIVPLILWLVFVVVGAITSFFKHLDDTRKPKNGNGAKLKTILAILPLDKISDSDPNLVELNKQKRNRNILYAIFLVLCAALSIFPLMYLFNSSHYTSDKEATSEVIDIINHIWPFVLIGFILFILTSAYENYSLNCSLIAAKNLLKDYKKGPLNYKEETRKKIISLWVIRGIIILIGIIFIIDGINNGGPNRVYMKAAKICSECIGLG